MARSSSVRVRIDDFEDGVLPLVCVSTGAPAEHRYRVSATSKTSGAVWLALLAGPVGLVLAVALSSILRRRTEGLLPYTDEQQLRILGRVRTAAWGAVAALGVAVGGFLLMARTEGGFAGLGLLLCALALVVAAFAGFLWLNPPGSAGATIDSTGRWVELDPVAPAFARAYEEQEARRRAARRAEAAGLGLGLDDRQPR
jgi:hypothetical protein